jgi:hypothetical protein
MAPMRAIVAFSIALVVPCAASAQTLFDRGPPESRIVHRSLVAFRINPLGLVYDGRIGYRHRLYLNESKAMRDNYVGGGLGLMLSPAYLRVGPYVEFAPMSMVTLWSQLSLVSYFGSFDLVQSFPSPRSEWSDDELERLGELDEPNKNYSALGSELSIGVDLQARVGPVMIRTRAKVVRGDVDLRSGDRVYYDQLYDTLLPDGGWMFNNDLDVAWMGLRNRLVLGLRYTATAPIYGDRYQVGEPEESDNGSHRLGPLISYSFKVEDGAKLNAPSVILICQWWLDHRYRAGQESSQGMPLIALAFQFYGDLLPFD